MQNQAQPGWQEEESFIDAAFAPVREQAPVRMEGAVFLHRAVFLARQAGRWDEAAYFQSLLRTISPVVLVTGPYGAAEIPAFRQLLAVPFGLQAGRAGWPIPVLCRYGREPKVFLHFRPGFRLSAPLPAGLAAPVRAHMQRYAGQFIPPLAVPVSRVTEYVTAAPFFQKIEWFLPSPLLQNGLRLLRPAEAAHTPRALASYMRNASRVVLCFPAQAVTRPREKAWLQQVLGAQPFPRQQVSAAITGLPEGPQGETLRRTIDTLCQNRVGSLFFLTAEPGEDSRRLFRALTARKPGTREQAAVLQAMCARIRTRGWLRTGPRWLQQDMYSLYRRAALLQQRLLGAIPAVPPVIPRHLPESATDIAGHIAFLQSLLVGYHLPKDATAKLEENINGLRSRQNRRELHLAVVGEFSSGKSSFINALLRENLLETDVVQGTTVASTCLRFSEQRYLQIDGGKPQTGLDPDELAQRLSGYNSSLDDDPAAAMEEKTGPAPQLEVGHPSDFLRQGVCIIDTPGTNSLARWHEDVTRRTLRQEADACLVLTGAEKPFPQTFRHFLQTNMAELLPDCVFVATKIDLIPPRQQARQVQYIKKILEDQMDVPEALVLPYSSLFQLTGTGGDFTDINRQTEETILQFVQANKQKILLQRCVELLEEATHILQQEFDRLEQEQQQKHDELEAALTRDLQEFVQQQKEELGRQFQQKVVAYGRVFGRKLAVWVQAGKQSVYKKFRALTTEAALQAFCQTGLRQAMQQAWNTVWEETGLTGPNAQPAFVRDIRTMGEEICETFETNFQSSYRQLAVLARDLVNRDHFAFSLAAAAAAEPPQPVGGIYMGRSPLWGAVMPTGSEKFRQRLEQLTPQVEAVVEPYFARLHNRVLKVYGRYVRDCRVQVEQVMNQYLWAYTAAVERMRADNRRQEAVTRHTLAQIRADQDCLKQECRQISQARQEAGRL